MTLPPLDPSTIAIGLAMIVALGIFVWFFVGMQMNLTRGNAALRWLKDGLSLLTEKTSLRWLGSSVIQLTMTSPRAPFKHIDILVMMEPRDVVPLWVLTYRQGRRDTLILRGHLRRAARHEFDIVDRHSWSGKDALAHHTPDAWPRSESGSYTFAAENQSAAGVARELMPLAQRMGGRLVRFSARRTVPNVEIHIVAPWRGDVSSKDAAQVFKDIGEALLPRL